MQVGSYSWVDNSTEMCVLRGELHCRIITDDGPDCGLRGELLRDGVASQTGTKSENCVVEVPCVSNGVQQRLVSRVFESGLGDTSVGTDVGETNLHPVIADRL